MRNFLNDAIIINFIFLCVLVNTTIISIEGLIEDKNILDNFDRLNFIFTLIYTVEVMIKIFALGVESKILLFTNIYFIHFKL